MRNIFSFFLREKKFLILAALIFTLILGFSLFQVLSLTDEKFNLNHTDFDYKFLNTSSGPTEDPIETEKTLNPKSPVELAHLAQLYILRAKKTGSTSNYEQAESWAQAALKIDPNNLQAHSVMIKVLLAKHQFQEALIKLDERYADSTTAESLYFRAHIFMALSRFSESLSQINSLLKIKPDLGNATLKALVLSHMGQDELAFHYFKRALQVEDIGDQVQSVLTRGQFAQFLIKKGRYAEALELCDAALAIIPENPFINFVKSHAYMSQGKYGKALSLLQTSFGDSKEPIYLLYMVFALKALNKEKEFKAFADQALKIYEREAAHNDYGHLIDLANLYYVTGDYKKSFSTLIKNRKIRKNLRGEISLAKTLMKINRIPAAREVLEEQIANSATDVTLFYLMIEVLTGNENENLRKIFKRKIQLNNRHLNTEILMAIP